jgi:hypothetical protein
MSRAYASCGGARTRWRSWWLLGLSRPPLWRLFLGRGRRLDLTASPVLRVRYSIGIASSLLPRSLTGVSRRLCVLDDRYVSAAATSRRVEGPFGGADRNYGSGHSIARLIPVQNVRY